MKCFCGKEAEYWVKVLNQPENYEKFVNCPRCTDCTERAKRSYVNVQVKELKKNV